MFRLITNFVLLNCSTEHKFKVLETIAHQTSWKTAYLSHHALYTYVSKPLNLLVNECGML